MDAPHTQNLALGEVDDALATALEGADEGESSVLAQEGATGGEGGRGRAGLGAVAALLREGEGKEKEKDGATTKRPKIEEL